MPTAESAAPTPTPSTTPLAVPPTVPAPPTAPPPVRRLSVLHDPACQLCRHLTAWLRNSPQLVPLEFVPVGSAQAHGRWPGLDHQASLGEITVVADTGEVWRGAQAFVVCLWALAEHRPLAHRLATPAGLPVARAAAFAASKYRQVTGAAPTGTYGPTAPRGPSAPRRPAAAHLQAAPGNPWAAQPAPATQATPAAGRTVPGVEGASGPARPGGAGVSPGGGPPLCGDGSCSVPGPPAPVTEPGEPWGQREPWGAGEP